MRHVRTAITRQIGLTRVLLGVLAAVLLLCAAGCEIQKPAMPTFSTHFTVPLGTHEVTVEDLIEDQDFLYAGADSVLAFSLEGDTTFLELDIELSVDLVGESIDTELGPIDLPAAAPLNFGFTLLEIYPEAALLPPGPVPVPGFDIDLASEAADLADITSAHVSSGSLHLVMTNNLPIPVSGFAPPTRLSLEILDPADGSVIVTAVFDGSVAPGSTAETVADLAGAILPDQVMIRLVGGSAGGFAPDGLAPDDGLDVSILLEGLAHRRGCGQRSSRGRRGG